RRPHGTGRGGAAAGGESGQPACRRRHHLAQRCAQCPRAEIVGGARRESHGEMEMKESAPKTFGYSGTPLINKLGIKPEARIQFVAAPKNFRDLLGPLPKQATVKRDGALDFAILFTRDKSALAAAFPGLRDRLESNGMLWVAWPKKTSGVETDLT